MKKYQHAIFLAAVLILAHSNSAFASVYAEFNPAKAAFVSPSARQNKQEDKKEYVKIVPAVKAPAAPSLSPAQVKNLVLETMSNLVASGALKGEKGEKGERGDVANIPTMASYNPSVTEFQPVHIPSFAMSDVGTFFSATNLSSDNITSSSATLGDIDSDGNLTVAGNTELQGETTLSTTTISGLRVGTLESDSGAYLSEGGAWVNASSRELKENLATTSAEDILEKIALLPIYSWNYKAEDATVSHVGPMAEDFYDSFHLGGENGNKNISTIDPAGIALLGIKALNEKLERQTFDVSWFLDGLKNMGVEISNGIMKAKEFAADSVRTKTLEVGTSENPSGVTIYDRATGEPICVFSENAILKSEAGKCGEVAKEIPVLVVPEAPEVVSDIVVATASTSTEVLEDNQNN
jgi:hypothetical protein